MADQPSITVVVPSHDRPLRLRWLLNALEEQTLPRERWRVVVAHDSRAPDTEALLEGHPLAAAGTLSHVRLPPGTGSPAVQRNTGWRAAPSPLVAFTDDDCRPEPEWLERLVEQASAHPDAIVQGRTLPDPYEVNLLKAPRHRTLSIEPPSPFAQTCNIAYPKAMLHRLGGFDETYPAPAGEDMDLGLRARAAGARIHPAPRAVTFHAVEAYGLPGMLRLNWKWQHLAHLYRAHPEARQALFLSVFWRKSHLRLLLALAGLWLSRRSRPAVLAAVPYARQLAGWNGPTARGRLRSLVEAPSRVTVELGELAACIRGSVRYRTPFL